MSVRMCNGVIGSLRRGNTKPVRWLKDAFRCSHSKVASNGKDFRR